MTVQIYTCSNHALRTLIGCKGVVPMATSCCLLSSSVITDMALNIYNIMVFISQFCGILRILGK